MALLKKLNKSKQQKTQTQQEQSQIPHDPSSEQAYQKSRYKPSIVEQPSQLESASMRGSKMEEEKARMPQNKDKKQYRPPSLPERRLSEAPKKVQVNREIASKYFTNAEMNQKHNIFGFVLGTKRIADIVLVQLLNFDGRTVFISMPEADIERLQNLQYLCLKKVVLYEDDGKECGMATKKQVQKTIYNDD